MRCSLRSSKICLRPRSRRQSPHKNFAGVGCVGKNFGTQRRVGSHCGRVGKLEAPCRLKKKSNPHLKESVIKSAPTSVGEPNARAHSLTQSRPSQQNCYGPQGTWEKISLFNHHGSEQNCPKPCSWDNHCAPCRAAVVHDE